MLRFHRRERRQPPLSVCLAIEGQPEGLGSPPIRLMLDKPVEVKHVIEHKPRPAAPRPERITVVYEMQDGSEMRTYIPLHGQRDWTEAWPHWLNPNHPSWPPVVIRYHFGYSDTGY